MSGSLVHIFIAAAVLVGLVFLSAAQYLNPVLDWGRVGTEFAISPLVAMLSQVKSFFATLVELRDLVVKNEILTRQVEKLTSEVATLEKARQENRVLREALRFASETKLEVLSAEVITWNVLNVGRLATLNRGTKHGVSEGKAVVTAGGVLVGVIASTSELTSQMEILTSSGVVVNAEVSAGGATGVVRGEHGLGLTFDLVSQTEVIKVGDRLITSGLGGLYPKGLLIGEIGKLNSSQSELFQKASVLPATNLQNLRVVFVVK